MATTWIEGFEVCRHQAHFTDRYSPSTFGGVPIFSAGRLFGFCLQAPAGTGIFLRTPSLSAGAYWVMGASFDMDGPLDGLEIFRVYDGANKQLALRVKASGASDWKLEVVRGTTVLATTTQTVVGTGGWKYVEWKVEVDPLYGSFEVRVGEETILKVGGVNTANAGTATANVAELGIAFTGAHARVDDWYVLDGTGVNQDFLGEIFIEGALPIADGTLLEWTPFPTSGHAVQVDDSATAAPDDDATYVKKAAVALTDLYGMGYLSYLSGQVIGISVIVRGKLELAGSAIVKLVHRDEAGNVREWAQLEYTTTGYLDKVAVREDSASATGQRWSVDELRYGQLGLRSAF